MPNSSEKLGNLGIKLNSGRGFLVGLTFWTGWPPTPGVEGDPGGGGGAILLLWAALRTAGGGRGARGGAGGNSGVPGGGGGKGGPPGRPKPPRAVVGLKGLPLFCCCCGITVELVTTTTGPLRLSTGSRVTTPLLGTSSSKNPGAWRVSDSIKKFWLGLCPPPLGSNALRTKEHWVLQILSLLTAS